MHKEIINALGQQCPVPVVMATRALREMKEPGLLEIHVDNEAAVQNLIRMATGHHFAARSEKTGEQEYVVTVEVTEVSAEAGEVAEPVAEEPACTLDQRGDFVVAVGSDCMGSGDEKLGHTLMKGFLFALTQLEQLPAKIIFYNSGARLTSAASDSLEDLRNLEAQGVEIWTCGTCVNFYELSAPAVGEVTNMYSIAEMLTAAGKVVRP